MKQSSFLTLISLLLLFPSCTLKFSNLKGTYLDKPYEIQTDKDYEATWSNIIDLFAQNGLSIKLLDKSSGLIISEKTSFIKHYTYENKKGQLIHADAWIVLAKPKTSNPMSPTDITGIWNIRIKKSGTGTLININLTNIDAYAKIRPTAYIASSEIKYPARSTGIFEQQIADLIK